MVLFGFPYMHLPERNDIRLVMVYTPLNILERIELKSDNSKIIRKFIKY